MNMDSINELIDDAIAENESENSLEKLLQIAKNNARKKKRKLVGGYDMRTNETSLNETMLSQIAENMRKLKLLNLLENPQISEIEKLQRLENYRKTDSISGHFSVLKKSGMVDLERYTESTYGTDMTKGGLFSDWNNDVF
jgi:phosphoenolpyruvate carboxylase